MNKLFGSVAALLASAAVAAGAPVATASPVDAGTPADGDGALDLSVPGAAEEWFASLGISPERIAEFAHGLGLDVEGFYASIRRTWANPAPGPAPVEFRDGKVIYNNTVARPGVMSFTRSRTRTEQGTRDVASGDCRFDETGLDSTFGDAVVSEVVELDTATCTRKVFDGAYDPSVQPTVSPLLSGSQWRPCDLLTDPPTRWQPRFDWADGESRRYFKHSFVDPVCITITSSALNVRWKNAVNSSTDVTLLPGTNASNFSFTRLGEKWPTDRKRVWLVPDPSVTKTVTGEVTAFLGHVRTETDFPEHLALAAVSTGAAINDPSVFLSVFNACGGDLSDTTFASSQWLKLRRRGGWTALGSAEVFGGCSRLVHDRVWHGTGSFAR